jgi:hypothetical protein
MNLKVSICWYLVQNNANPRSIQISSGIAILLLWRKSLSDSQWRVQRVRDCGLERIVNKKETILDSDVINAIEMNI